eukprot:4345672-Amphidinium_carterae.1
MGGDNMRISIDERMSKQSLAFKKSLTSKKANVKENAMGSNFGTHVLTKDRCDNKHRFVEFYTRLALTIQLCLQRRVEF